MDGETLQQKTTHKARENCKLQDLQRQEGSGGAFGILGQQIQAIIIMYLYSAQYLHILQDSKRYLTNPTVQIQPQLTSN